MVEGGCSYRSLHNKSVRSDNSYAQSTDGTFIHISEFVVDEDADHSTTICNTLQVQPLMNRDLPTVTMVNGNRDNAHIDTNRIKTVCVVVKVDDTVYLTPPPPQSVS
ncbi:hypothetical protein QAD02_013789 [Eretmocerus hayati]|uniref:Uncharacterized protein n=1 Tax=Eretmocerus hayati TaxID=131215 RepID=A0ACC2P3R5_9HYME|nr:hypothetical protein QAD02_013789 [Eretmocerus hayati]